VRTSSGADVHPAQIKGLLIVRCCKMHPAIRLKRIPIYLSFRDYSQRLPLISF
jgi:hypothetical protein